MKAVINPVSAHRIWLRIEGRPKKTFVMVSGAVPAVGDKITIQNEEWEVFKVKAETDAHTIRFE